jgi:hypothetical protein
VNRLRPLERWDREFNSRGMDVCVRLFCVCAVLCVGRGLVTSWSPFQGVLPTVYRIKKLKKRPRSTRALKPQMDIPLSSEERNRFIDAVLSVMADSDDRVHNEH